MSGIEELFEELLVIYLEWLRCNGSITKSRQARIIQEAMKASEDATLRTRKERVQRIVLRVSCDSRTVETTLDKTFPLIKERCTAILQKLLESPAPIPGGRGGYSPAEKQVIRVLVEHETRSVRKQVLAYLNSSGTSLQAVASSIGVSRSAISKTRKKIGQPLARLAREILKLLPKKERV